MRGSKIVVSILIFALFSSSAIAGKTERFVHMGLGFSIVKPDNWVWIIPQMNLVAIDKEFASNEELQDYLDKYPKDFFFSIIQEPISDSEFTATIRARVKEYRTFKGYSAKKLLETFVKHFPESFYKYKLLKATEEVELSGVKSAHILFEHTVVLENNIEVNLKSDVWIIPAEKYFFMIDAETLNDDTSGKRIEIMNIMKTLSIRG